MDEAARRHAEAEARGDAGYEDPASGLFVLTASYLRGRGYCCGRGCRHCPYPAAEQRRAGRSQIREDEVDGDDDDGSDGGQRGSSTKRTGTRGSMR